MPNYVRLNNVDHADLRVMVGGAAAYGDAVNQCPLFPIEFEAAQREFPILFRRDGAIGWQAVAITGLDRDENLFLGEVGWDSEYIPAVQRRGPFAADLADGSLSIDLDDPRVGMEAGEPLYRRHGGTAPYLREVERVFDLLRRGHAGVAATYSLFDRHGLLKPVTLELEIEDALSYHIDEVWTVDEAVLGGLDGAALADLHAGGALRAAMMAAVSLANVTRLIRRKRDRLAR